MGPFALNHGTRLADLKSTIDWRVAVHRFLLGPIAALGLLIAAPGWAQPEFHKTPEGPGTLFASIDGAASDALSWAHQLQREGRSPRLSRGGTIVAVEGRYTYGELVTARRSAPDKLVLELGVSAVAHFHTYPRQGGPIDRRNESHSRADRWVVDRLDSQRRPSYILTPSLRVVAYHGRAEARTSDLLVANLSQPADGQILAAY